MSRFQELPNSVSFPALEAEVLARWRRERTFERSLARRVSAPAFVFYDGPPFATGLPHYGHILTSFIKDVVPRYQTMRGFRVPRRWGWDCHGLPVELEVEKALGIASRTDVLRHGMAAFNDACRSLVMRYQAEWERVVERLGRWVDFENAYKTMDGDFVESVVWCFKALHERGLIYEGQKVAAYCPRCQTALSNFEARLDDAFRPRCDVAVTVRFALLKAPGESLLAWTTTPWTLPSNVALAVHPSLEYTRMQRGDEAVWLASSAIGRYARPLEGFEATAALRGSELLGRTYRPPFATFASWPGAFRVLPADFVSAEDGTGIVHLAPAFGEDDQAVCSAHGLDGPNPVRDDGTFDERLGDLAGLSVFAANEPIARRLASAGLLFARESHRHDYPHCWRCDSPLLYRAVASWFVRVSAFKERMVELNERIRWVPAHVGERRFADWLRNARDWAVSRNRFWGAPIPVWRCEGCARTQVVGSRAELERLSGARLLDWHRPGIDAVELPCPAGDGVMRRVPEVLDCWFESGAMPYGQAHYPFGDKEAFEAAFPGDFIVEYVAQTRGWFYTMLALSTALFDKEPFRNAVCHGVLLAEDGRKMSKRLRNFPDPMALVEEHGSDALRAALLMSGAVSGADIRFAAGGVRDSVRRFHLPLWNALHLFTAYASLDGFEPTGSRAGAGPLDRYLLSETEALRTNVEAAMSGYDFAAAYRALDAYLVMLTTWHLRRVKAVLWRAGLDAEKSAAYEALHAALSQAVRIAAPFLPFLAEAAFTALGHEDSVHLSDWPEPHPDWQDAALLCEMRTVREVVHLGHQVRDACGLRHRQPLRRALVHGLAEPALSMHRDLLEAELNVKDVSVLEDVSAVVRREVVLDRRRLGKRLRGEFARVAEAVAAGEFSEDAAGRLEAAGHGIERDEYATRSVPRSDGQGVAASGDLVVVLDLALDDVLLREGWARDLSRAVQDLRKEARLAYDERIVVSLVGGGPLAGVLREHSDWLKEQCLATGISPAALGEPMASMEIALGGDVVQVSVARSAPGA